MKNNPTYFALFVLLMLCQATKINAQCAPLSPPDVTLNCGNTAAITAPTDYDYYAITTTSCSPVVTTTTTNAFPTPADDEVTGQIPIGFTFNFFGTPYTTTVIQTNGIIGFGAFTFTGFNAFAIPASGTPNNYIAGIFTDIDIRFGGSISYQTLGSAPNRQFVVSYTDVVPFTSGVAAPASVGTATFQIVLNENGSFQVIISNFPPTWTASTSGVLGTCGAENATGTLAFVVPGRNSQNFTGITPANQDCKTFSKKTCVFNRWQQGATTISLTQALNVSPTNSTTYTGYWTCDGATCTDDTVITVAKPTISAGATANSTNCAVPDGSLVIQNNTGGTYTVNYLSNGVAATTTLTSGISSITQSTAFNVNLLSASDFVWNRNISGTTCSASSVGTSVYGDTFSFSVSTAGSYTFAMCTPGTDWDGFGSLYQNAFVSSNICGTPANFVIADDDGNVTGNCSNDALITATLNSGVTYFLITSSFSNAVTGNYEWTFTGPTGATLIATTSNLLLSNLSASTITNVTIQSAVGCASNVIAGPIVIGGAANKTWNGATDTNWTTATNWTPNGAPSAADCVYIANVANKPVVSGTNSNALGKTLTVLNGGLLNVNASNNITITDVVTVNNGGILKINDGASLLQTNAVANVGNATIERISKPLYRLDYTYWNSPVSLSSNFALSNLTDVSHIYSWKPTLTGGLAGDWLQESSSSFMNPNKGYISRAPSTFPNSGTKLAETLNFIGVPNNGIINIPIAVGTNGNIGAIIGGVPIADSDDQWNLIGNPYPSAIDIYSFLTNVTNVPIVDGTVYLWTHNTIPSSLILSPFYNNFGFNYTANDYATLNLMGATVSSAAALTGGSIPSRYIASGQAFFISGKINGTAIFNNAMRVLNNNSNFFKPNAIANDKRIWLNISSQNAFNQMMIGYHQDATLNFDRGLDSQIVGLNDTKIYSLIANEPLTIQAFPEPFNSNDSIPLGVITNTNDIYSIGIDHLDTFFNTENIYIEDTFTSTIHDLKIAPYTIALNAGSYNNRFYLRFQQTSLATTNFSLDNSVVVLNLDKPKVISSTDQIKSLEIFDVLGRKIDTYENLNTKELVLSHLEKTNSNLILKITLENNIEISKKIVY